MVSLGKKEILNYLKDYAVMSELIRNNPNRRIFDIYRDYKSPEGINDGDIKNMFIVMNRVYAIMTEIRMFSFKEDVAIKYLNEDELNIDDIKEKIFVNPRDARRFSKKQIIKNMRDAFNHSNSSVGSYDISVNGRYIEVIWAPQGSYPMHLKLNGEQLVRINDEMFKKSHNPLMALVDYDSFNFTKPYDDSNLDNLSFVKFIFSKKIDSSIIQQLFDEDFSRCESCNAMLTRAEEIIVSNGCTDYRITRTPLTDNQKNKVRYLLKNYKKMDLTKIPVEMIEDSIKSLLNDTIPLGMYHTDQLVYEQQFGSWFMSDGRISYNAACELLHDFYDDDYVTKSNNVDYEQFSKSRFDSIHSIIKDRYLNYIMMTRDYNSRVMYPIALFLGYIFDSICIEPTIKINGIEYETEKIRNSFVHGRWFFGTNEMIELYDLKPTINSVNNNELFENFEWHISLNFRDLLVAVTDKYDIKR